MSKIYPAIAALALVAFQGGCDETDAVAVRIQLAEDFSGRVMTSGLRIPDPGQPMEHLSQGVTWTSRVEMVCALGQFAKLSELRIEDIKFEVGSAGGELSYVEVVLPRGPSAAWPRKLVPLSEDERREAARTMTFSDRLDEVGSTVKIEIELPDHVIGHGLSARPHGSKEKAEGNKATLIVPIERSLEADDPLVWHLTWRKPDQPR